MFEERSLRSTAGEKRHEHATHNSSQEDAGYTADERCVDHTEQTGANRDEEEGIAEDRPGEQPQGTRRAPNYGSEQAGQQDALDCCLKGRFLHKSHDLAREGGQLHASVGQRRIGLR
jgi:hypothetical protein